jgi:hypothetical protein
VHFLRQVVRVQAAISSMDPKAISSSPDGWLTTSLLTILPLASWWMIKLSPRIRQSKRIGVRGQVKVMEEDGHDGELEEDEEGLNEGEEDGLQEGFG